MPDFVSLDADIAAVRRLIAEQFPQWAGLEVRFLPTAGTVNAIFRVGDSMAARFPFQPGEIADVRESIRRESAAAAEFAELSPVASPRPLGIGEPGHGYPLPWSMQTWVPGQDAIAADPAGSMAFAEDLAALIARMRLADTRGRRFTGSGRGGHLPNHDEWMNLCFAKSENLLDVPALRAMWLGLRALPAEEADVMSHGDLTPTNVLVDDGRLSGVLDTGGFAAADPALDLVSVWHLLDATQRMIVRESLACSELQWCRGMAWALQQAMGLVWYYAESNPVMSRWGRWTLDRLLEAYDG